jgi:methyltransferase (TIGR00027 family)
MARATAIEVLEIDHPATQGWKRELLRTRGLDLPAQLAFLPIDFETESLADAWPARSAPDFVSWLGATYYLTRDAIAGTLETLAAGTAPGSRLVLDYWSEQPPTAAGNLLLWGTRMAVALQQEPMLSFFEPDEIEALAADTGWSVVENLTAAGQNQRYLHARQDGLVVPSFAHLLQLTRTADR